jgi:hypothetical protein
MKMTDTTRKAPTRKMAPKAVAAKTETVALKSVSDVRTVGNELGLNLPAKGRLSVDQFAAVVLAVTNSGKIVDLSGWTAGPGSEKSAATKIYRVTARYDAVAGVPGDMFTRDITAEQAKNLAGTTGKVGRTSTNSFVRALASALSAELGTTFDFRLFESASVTPLDADGNPVEAKTPEVTVKPSSVNLDAVLDGKD